ncbi:hypothetical protein C7B62_19030 [Pleurocapsa sp. CCALA 161]|uniref:DUF6155 family protein n=1 Tax=Pleurocapsa sp. CCALA 161 TaxID=2107688 RepID=UPI000D05EBAF|nr:DUF6155 family protein [Pleurocapsa sp. CCALA 161]PSB07713.1 hypothetical protein C7B62_19030 [Pleurocapsa sp. CCALA 161]
MTQPKINLTTFKKHLKARSQEELIADISELYKRFQPVKDYYQIQLAPQDETQVAAKYKKIIEDEFFPTRGFDRAKLSVAKKAITEYKKVTKTATSLIDIMLFYVEQGVRFTDAYGDIDEPFYISMETMYEKAVNEIIKHGQQDIFQKRCYKIVSDTSDMGWGFHDTLSEIYEDAFQ